jgi:hypothetical protein
MFLPGQIEITVEENDIAEFQYGNVHPILCDQ